MKKYLKKIIEKGKQQSAETVLETLIACLLACVVVSMVSTSMVSSINTIQKAEKLHELNSKVLDAYWTENTEVGTVTVKDVKQVTLGDADFQIRMELEINEVELRDEDGYKDEVYRFK